MTASRDPDRIVRAWLDLMPSEAPDRAIDAVLQAVEAAPQLRPPIGAPFRRPFEMNRLSITAIAAALVVVFAGALVLTRFTAPPNAASSPTPGLSAAASPDASAAIGELPTTLRGTWLGSSREIQGTTATAGTQLHVGASSMALTPSSAGNRNLISVRAAADGATIRIETGPDPTDDCQAGQVGTYTYALSAQGQTLTIAASHEACPQREHLFVGTWWLADCHTQDSEPCLGLLDAGQYGSQYFASIGAHGVPWAADFGALTFTVPAGWAGTADFPSAFSVAPAADYAATALHEDPAEEVTVYSNVIAESQAGACSGKPDESIPSGAAAYVAWLRTVNGLSVGASSATTVGGHAALMVDVTAPNPPTVLCDGTDAVIEYLLSNGWYATSGTTGIQTHAISVGIHDRLILVDMPSGYLTAIVISAAGATFDAFAQQATPIVQSFQFTDAFPSP